MSGFEGFRDSPSAPFYRSSARSPDDTWAEAIRRLQAVISSATAATRHKPIDMTVEQICRWHRGVFLTTFPHDAGRIREDWEPAEFAIPIQVGGEMIATPMKGALPRSEIIARLRAACDRFNAARDTLRSRSATVTHSAVEGVTPPAELYAAILEIHPFRDGNLRAAYVALQVGLASLELPDVRFGHVIERHDECLGWAMRTDGARTIVPLAELTAELTH